MQSSEASNRVRYIETPEDYRDYLADRGLYEALKSREEIERTHSIPKLIRMWVDHLKGTENGSFSKAPLPLEKDEG